MTGIEVASIIQSVGLFITACTSLGALIQSMRNGRKATAIAANVETIEKATNSMKDALVKASKEASHAQGTAEGLVAGRAEERASHAEIEPVKVEIVKIPLLPGA